MDRSELFESWQTNKYRPAWVRQNREAIMEHTDTSEAIPDASLAEVRDWMDRFKGTVTTQLKPEASDDE